MMNKAVFLFVIYNWSKVHCEKCLTAHVKTMQSSHITQRMEFQFRIESNLPWWCLVEQETESPYSVCAYDGFPPKYTTSWKSQTSHWSVGHLRDSNSTNHTAGLFCASSHWSMLKMRSKGNQWEAWDWVAFVVCNGKVCR